MSARTFFAIVLGAIVSAVTVYFVARQLDVENAHVIAGGVGGGVGAVIGQAFARKRCD